MAKHVYSWESVPLIMDLRFAAVLLGKSYSCVKKLCSTGALPACKIGGEWRIEKDKIRDFISTESAAIKLHAQQSCV